MKCEDFKAGNLYFKSRYTGQEYYFKRNDSIQIEIDKKTGSKSKWAILWVNDCEYRLRFIKFLDNFIDTTHKTEFPDLDFKILKTGSNYYVFSGEIPFIKKVYEDTVWVVNH